MKTPKTQEICGMPTHRLRFRYHDYLRQQLKDQMSGEMLDQLNSSTPIPRLETFLNINNATWNQTEDYINEIS